MSDIDNVLIDIKANSGVLIDINLSSFKEKLFLAVKPIAMDIFFGVRRPLNHPQMYKSKTMVNPLQKELLN